MGLREGDPVECPCGGTLVVIWREPLMAMTASGKIKAGERFAYRCDRCRRDLEMRWRERYVLPRTGTLGGTA